MKKPNNHEMDLVLRAFAKSGREDSSMGIGRATKHNPEETVAHLDADELNSYAEGVVPDAARARYANHLAACERCRGIVINLVQASGAFSETPVKLRSSIPGFWQKIGVFFSSPVMRYALPALVVTSVIAISLLALRQERPVMVAQHQTSTPEPNTGSAEKPTASLVQTPTPRTETRVGSGSNAAATNDKTSAPAGRSENAKTTSGSDFVDKAPEFKDAGAAPPPTSPSETSISQPTFAPEPKAGALASGRMVPADAMKKAQTEEQTVDRVAQQRERDEYEVNALNRAEANQSASKAKAPSGPRRVGGLMADQRADRGTDKNEAGDKEQTRSISGRRFRRQGNAWIDTSYDSSRATINLTRGSEQFRALVADEPEIRTIANTLSGEVLVVWKGKAYRIR